jgi:Tfp pilus assembly protein PilE
LRFVVAVVLAFAAEAVLVAYHLQILDAHLVAALACLHVHNLAQRSYLEAERTRMKKGDEERKIVRNSLL